MTEDAPVLPGWAEKRLDEILAAFPDLPLTPGLRVRYLDCLARARMVEEREAGFEGCHQVFLAAMQESGADPDGLAALAERLEALEEEIIADS